jgi:hypothetical protein
MFGAKKSLPVPDILPTKCPDCGSKLVWEVVEYLDPVIGIRKVDHYRGGCANGHVQYRDQRGQVVEPAELNLPPDRSEFAQSPQGPQPYSGFIEFVKQERAKAEALKAKRAAEAAAPAKPVPIPAAAAASPSQPADPGGDKAPP